MLATFTTRGCHQLCSRLTPPTTVCAHGRICRIHSAQRAVFGNDCGAVQSAILNDRGQPAVGSEATRSATVLCRTQLKLPRCLPSAVLYSYTQQSAS